MIIIGIDASSGSRSAIGFAVVDTALNKIVSAKDYQVPKNKDLRPRLKHIAAFLVGEFKQLEAQYGSNTEYMIVIETTVMAGIGGQSLQRAIGAMLIATPSHRRVEFVYPMSVKKFITGEGKGGDKRAIADGLKRIFTDKESLDLIFNLTASSRWDMLDAVAIALTGNELHVEKSKIIPHAKPSKAIKKGVAKS
jgi:Holliday junction resolvasome RuvABC endonuclease subunit